MQQLEKRLLTAAVLAVLFLGAVFWLPTPWFALVLSAVVLAGVHEWSGLVAPGGPARRVLWLSAFCVLLGIAWLYGGRATPVLVAVGTMWWFAALWRLASRPVAPEPDWLRVVASVLTLLPAFAAVVHLHATDRALLISLFVVVWLCDSGAYFVGRVLGRRKLAPAISPGKTVEGLVGGIVSACVFAVAWALWAGAGSACGALWVAICAAAALFSVIGDLWESKLKRIAGVKDSGSLLPGHGGVLDRIDSITAAAPVFVAGLYLAGGDTFSCGLATVRP